MKTYLDLLPLDILAEILIYVDTDDIQNLYIFNIKDILQSRIFWIKRLQYEKLNIYIPFLGKLKEDYINEYFRFLEIHRDISEFAYYFKVYSAYMSIENSSDTDINTLIDGDLETFINCIGKCKYGCDISISSNRNIIKYYNSCKNSTNSGKLSDEEFKSLLIKLTISGFNLYELSNLEEIQAELSQENQIDFD